MFQSSRAEINFRITASSDSAVVGEQYSLLCSVAVNGSMDSPNITWFRYGVEISSDSTRTISVTTINVCDYETCTASNLTYTPLSASHAGTVMCRVTLGELVDTESVNINVKRKAFKSVYTSKMECNHVLM